jgi:phage gp36-like protein
MAYTTEDNVRKATGFNVTANITSAVVVAYIADADSVINAVIGERYSLPLSSTPDIIETLSRHITVGLLYANEYGEETENLDKGWKGRMDWAMEQLGKIQKGKLKLYVSNAEMTRASLHQPAFYPTVASSEEDVTDSTAAKITMNKEF